MCMAHWADSTKYLSIPVTQLLAKHVIDYTLAFFSFLCKMPHISSPLRLPQNLGPPAGGSSLFYVLWCLPVPFTAAGTWGLPHRGTGQLQATIWSRWLLAPCYPTASHLFGSTEPPSQGARVQNPGTKPTWSSRDILTHFLRLGEGKEPGQDQLETRCQARNRTRIFPCQLGPP